MTSQDYAIKGEAFKLSKVFSSDFQYLIPNYQRPYSWEVENIEQLFDDLYDFFQGDTEETYFLGSVVVIKKDHFPESYVVDGQQRLTSLTILLSVLASLLSDKSKANSIELYIKQPENLAESIPAQPRLTLRKQDNDFFSKYIQNIKIEELKSINIDSDCKTDAQKNIYKNTLALVKRVKDKFEGDEEGIFEFCKFIIQKCCIVIVSTPNEKSAFRIFSVMNDRGLDLLPSDILKSYLIGKMSSKQDEYTDKWEDLEQDLGRARFNELFSHIRMIYLKTKAQKSLLDEFQESIIPNINSVSDFIDTELTSYADKFNALKSRNYRAGNFTEEINGYLFWLNKVNFSEWIPVVIRFLYAKPTEQLAYDFFKHLDCLTSYIYLSAKNINDRIYRFGDILKQLENDLNCSKELKIPNKLYLTDEEKQEFKLLLDGNVYQLVSPRRNYLILRMDSMISDGAATYNLQKDSLTIEHVLPQTIEDGSQWSSWWDVDNHKLWVHRLANLVPLNRRRNSSASNLEFKDKKEKYFKGNNNVSSYALTTQVLDTEEWTPDIVAQRQGNLLSRLYKEWELI
ncbi:DUF262 domain-containing protein [Haemophilus influenzae]|uniref:DUF262 domain-containing protein n=3 Tax=Haemophilus influenzae TaxID=727 RepID=UPI0001A66011|nr:DUF262 domain-containing protein [Haemophilus influenzae]AXP54982.1 DUF262 domain-containing protein [Haemophilus influenzae]AXP76503.1 DUF262 domain-containing protein [Haemophilus influenzae]KIP46868.1 hypothetical protein SU55_00350 [Haemophilus influenzae]KIP47194.1 hypothetical protein SU56_01540 [Haemophilus influenzae]KMZ22990.1 hypothetical protein ABN54_03915 [Haemophilus influenzae]